jgi:hypothetical protein
MLKTSDWGTSERNLGGVPMKVEFVRNTMTSSGNARIGQVLELPEQEAKLLIKTGRCAKYIERVLENTSIGLEVSETPLIKRGRPKKVL